MQLTVLGCGDAFGTGGRLQPAFLAEDADTAILLDCGATAVGALQATGRSPNAVSHVLLSHLHGDHFAGLVWLVLHGLYPGRRQSPLTIAGPPDTRARLAAVLAHFYPGVTLDQASFPISFRAFEPGETFGFANGRVTAWAASHPSGSPACAVRYDTGNTVIGYSGDTEWIEDLIAVAAEADLFICECYARHPGVRYHLDWETLSARFDDLTAKRILITHMSNAMLQDTTNLRKFAPSHLTFAEDFLSIAL